MEPMGNEVKLDYVSPLRSHCICIMADASNKQSEEGNLE